MRAGISNRYKLLRYARKAQLAKPYMNDLISKVGLKILVNNTSRT